MPLEAVTAMLVTAGVLSGLVVAVRARAPHEGLRVLLDFLLAAGLIRLLGPRSWSTLAAVVLTIAVRQVAGRGLAAAGATRRRMRTPDAPSGASTGHDDATDDGATGRLAARPRRPRPYS